MDLAIRAYNICIPGLCARNVVIFFAAKEYAFNRRLTKNSTHGTRCDKVVAMGRQTAAAQHELSIVPQKDVGILKGYRVTYKNI